MISPVILLLVAGIALLAGGIIVTGSFNPKIVAIGKAIAHAEGFGVTGALPTRANNPGDLKLGDVGKGHINGKTVFPDEASGWRALYHQIEIMVNGQSDFYDPNDSWRRVAQVWVGTSDYTNWLNTVVSDLGVSPDSSLQDYINS